MRQRPGVEQTTEQTELDKSNQRLAEQQRYGNNYQGQPAVPGTYFQPQPQPYPGQLFPGQPPFTGPQQFPGQPLFPGQSDNGRDPNERNPNQQDRDREFQSRQFGDRQFPGGQPFPPGNFPGNQPGYFPGQNQPYPGGQNNQPNPGQNQPYPGGQQYPNTIPPTMGTCDTTGAVQRFQSLFPGQQSTAAACTTCHTDLCNAYNGGSLVTGRVHLAIVASLGVIFAMKKILN